MSSPPSTQGPFVLPPPPHVQEPPPMTEDQRQRIMAHMDELLAHLADPPEEPDWDVETLFPPDRVR